MLMFVLNEITIAGREKIRVLMYMHTQEQRERAEDAWVKQSLQSLSCLQLRSS